MPAVVGAFLGAAATSPYYGSYSYYNGYSPASYGWGSRADGSHAEGAAMRMGRSAGSDYRQVILVSQHAREGR